MALIVWIVVGVISAIVIFFIAYAIATKMKGSIEIIPEKYSYSPGEEVKGKVILKLKKPIEADELTIGLLGQTKTKINNETRTEDVFSFSQPIEKKKNYSPSEYSYDFSIKIPEDVEPSNNPVISGGLSIGGVRISGARNI